MRQTMDLKISAPLGDGGRACIPPFAPIGILAMEALFPWVAEATSNALEVEVLLTPWPSGFDHWPPMLYCGSLRFSVGALGSVTVTPSEVTIDRWGQGVGPPHPTCVTFTLTLAPTPLFAFALCVLASCLRSVVLSTLCTLSSAFALCAFFGGGFLLSFLHPMLGYLIRSLPPSPWY
jgi:hypothetical protein